MTDRDRLIELIYCAGRDYDDYVDSQHEIGMSAYEDFDEWLADELIANGFILPPCKVGDTVYIVGMFTGQIISNKVVAINYGDSGLFLLLDSYTVVSVEEQLGKTVFLTKEEAEAKLKELGK